MTQRLRSSCSPSYFTVESWKRRLPVWKRSFEWVKEKRGRRKGNMGKERFKEFPLLGRLSRASQGSLNFARLKMERTVVLFLITEKQTRDPQTVTALHSTNQEIQLFCTKSINKTLPSLSEVQKLLCLLLQRRSQAETLAYISETENYLPTRTLQSKTSGSRKETLLSLRSQRTDKHTPREKKALIMKLKLMVATVKTSRKTKTNVGSLLVSTAPLGLT